MKEKLEQRLQLLEEQKEQHIANANACGGGIEVIKQLLSDILKEESKTYAQDHT